MSFLDLKNKKWEHGNWTYINKLQWGEPELENIISVLSGDWFAGNSKWNIQFETKLKEFTGLKYYQTTNSGSSAIEIAVQTLIQKGLLKRGDKILHPGLTFPTSITSAMMAGLVPVFADVGEGTYVLSNEAIEDAFMRHPDIAGAIVPLLLGNTPDIEFLLAKLDGKPLIIDSCDTMGTKWLEREVGTYADFAAYSFYGSHHISTFGVGGGLGTNNREYAEYANSITFWGRDFSTDKLDAVENFLRRYSYKSLGLDAQMSAIQAGFGLAQMDRLPEYLGQRDAIFVKLQRLFSRHLEYFTLPERVDIRADVSWFCYPITLNVGTPFSREYFVKYLLDNKIEIRPIMATILNHEPFVNAEYHVVGNLRNSEIVNRRGFFLPCAPMGDEQLEYYMKTLETFLGRY